MEYFLGIVALVVSLIAAEFASGSRGTWAWGFLGPAGWAVAGLRGVQMRQDELLAANRNAAQSAAPPRASLERMCPKCGHEQMIGREFAGDAKCVRCGTTFLVSPSLEAREAPGEQAQRERDDE